MSETETGGSHSSRVSVRYRSTTLSTRWAGKRFFFKDFSEFLDVFVETQPCVVDLVGSINKSANETRIVGIKYKAKIISHQSASPTLSY